MKKVKINGFIWFYDKETNSLYESESLKSNSIPVSKLTRDEIKQLHTWIYYNGIPMYNFAY